MCGIVAFSAPSVTTGSFDAPPEGIKSMIDSGTETVGVLLVTEAGLVVDVCVWCVDGIFPEAVVGVMVGRFVGA